MLASRLATTSSPLFWRCHTALQSVSHIQPRRFAGGRPDSSHGWLVTCAADASSSSSPVKVPKYRLRPLTKDDVDASYARSSGPGGQNVNKVNTKVDMRLDVDKATWIPDEVKGAIRAAEKNRFTSDGVLVMTSTRHRNQTQNFDDALAKLQEIVDRAVWSVTPTIADPETVKRVKANIKAGQENRLQNKKKDSMRKSLRSSKNFD